MSVIHQLTLDDLLPAVASPRQPEPEVDYHYAGWLCHRRQSIYGVAVYWVAVAWAETEAECIRLLRGRVGGWWCDSKVLPVGKDHEQPI